MQVRPYPLTDEQREIADARPERATLVLAPPGAGKTHVVIARILSLVERYGLQPRAELLVLCFTRAAVAEIDRRLKALVRDRQAYDDLRFVSVRTLDSFGTRLLLAASPQRDLSDVPGYDASIQLVTEMLSASDSEESRLVAGVKHLIVDEIQDLVGVRARLVRMLLARITGGFTLLGDPAQAIYDFSVSRRDGGENLSALLSWLRGRQWAGGLSERTLAGNRRSSAELAKLSASVRGLILDAPGSSTHPLQRLQELVGSLDTVGSAMEPQPQPRNEPQSSCILCRSNGEALQVSSLLAWKDVDYWLRPRPEDAGLPAWIRRVLGLCTSQRLSRKAFEERWRELIGDSGEPGWEAAWTSLKRLEGRGSSDIDVRCVHDLLRRGHRLPDDSDAYLARGSGVSISTVHAVKGREFDRVIILKPEERQTGDGTSPLEEARVLYVAATRAREGLYRLDRAGLPRMWKVKCGGGRTRWVTGGTRRCLARVEIGLPGDVDPASGVSTYLHADDSAASTTQELIWREIRPGKSVYISLFRAKGYSFYRIRFKRGDGDYVNIGQLSRQCVRDIGHVLAGIGGAHSEKLPRSILGVRVVAVVTEVLPPFPARVLGPYATSGFCLGVRPRGMGALQKG